MPAEVTMPQLSDTMTEGTVVRWNKAEGDKVKAGDELAEIETDKATMAMEAFDDGTLAVIKVPGRGEGGRGRPAGGHRHGRRVGRGRCKPPSTPATFPPAPRPRP